MPSFQINDEEWDALFDEPHQLLKVYCAIRMFMDYRTGIAGETRRLSEQMLKPRSAHSFADAGPATATR